MPFAVQLDLDAVARIGDRLPFISAGADPRSRNSAPDWRCSPHLTGGLRGFTRRALRGRFGPICCGARTVGRATRQYRHIYGRTQCCLPRSCPDRRTASAAPPLPRRIFRLRRILLGPLPARLLGSPRDVRDERRVCCPSESGGGDHEELEAHKGAARCCSSRPLPPSRNNLQIRIVQPIVSLPDEISAQLPPRPVAIPR